MNRDDYSIFREPCEKGSAEFFPSTEGKLDTGAVLLALGLLGALVGIVAIVS